MNNPFLVCSDRELRALPTQWLLAECWDKAGSILDDLEFMDSTVRRLGIEQIIGKLQEAEMLIGQGQNVGISANHSISVSSPIIAGGRKTWESARSKYAG